jgi:hypothetical protein
VNVENKHNKKLERLGFSYERGGVHTARTMMLAELRALLSFVDMADAARADYLEAIQTANCLGKRSGKTRTLTFRHLADLYALDPSLLVFRALRFFWQRDVEGQPLLAALCAFSRDPMLRATAPFVLDFQEGATVTREGMEEFIDAQEPGRFSKATLKSTAQNINSSWTQSGHLAGRVRKVRARAVATPGTVSLALLLGYVSGLRGESLSQERLHPDARLFIRKDDRVGRGRLAPGLDLAQARRPGGRSAFPEPDHCAGNGVAP